MENANINKYKGLLSSLDANWIKLTPLISVMIDKCIERTGVTDIKEKLKDISEFYFGLSIVLLSDCTLSRNKTIMNKTVKVGKPIFDKEEVQQDSWQAYISSALILLDQLLSKLNQAVKYKKKDAKKVMVELIDISEMNYEVIEEIVDQQTTCNTVVLANEILVNIENNKL